MSNTQSGNPRITRIGPIMRFSVEGLLQIMPVSSFRIARMWKTPCFSRPATVTRSPSCTSGMDLIRICALRSPKRNVKTSWIPTLSTTGLASDTEWRRPLTTPVTALSDISVTRDSSECKADTVAKSAQDNGRVVEGMQGNREGSGLTTQGSGVRGRRARLFVGLKVCKAPHPLQPIVRPRAGPPGTEWLPQLRST